MSSTKIASVVSGLVSRRSYGVYARAVNVQASAAAAAVAPGKTDVATTGASLRATKKDKFWMRDPKTGYWVPENRFDDEVDVVDLRNRLIRHK